MRLAILLSLLLSSVVIFFGFEVVLTWIEVSAKPNPWLVLFIGLIIFSWRIFSDSRKWKYEKSAFRLTSALEAFEEAHKLLTDGNNDRVTWISAARALKRGKHMADGITEDIHIDVLEVQQDRFRIIFGNILGADNKLKGIDFFEGKTPTSKILRDPTQATRLASVVWSIPPSTLKVIWDFSRFPPEYEDPVPFGESFSDAEIDSAVNLIRYPGLVGYLQKNRKR